MYGTRRRKALRQIGLIDPSHPGLTAWMALRLWSSRAVWEGRSEKPEWPRRRLLTSRPRVQGYSRPSRRPPPRSSLTNAPKFQPEDSPRPSTPPAEEDGEIAEVEREETEQPASFWSKLRGWFAVDKSRLQSLGIGAFLAYGFVSNVNYGITFTIAWLTHVKRTGVIPLARGQWLAFLGLYAGLWTIQNTLRPARIAAAIALTPLVNQMLQYLVQKLGIRRRQAVLLLLFGLAVFTISSLVMSIWILGGIPSRPPKPV